jgi:hypothetical protein
VGSDTLQTPHVSLTPLWAENHYAPDLLPRLLPPKPVPFLCCDTTGLRRPNSCRWAIHPSPPRATRMTACPPATLSHCVNCDAPWHPVTTAPLCLLLTALPAGEIPAMPRAKVLHPSLCELSSHPSPASKPHCRQGIVSPCCAGQPLSRPLRHHNTDAKHSTTRPHAAPLLPPSLLTPRASHLASSSLAPRHVGTIHWHTHVHGVAMASTPPVQLTTPMPVYRQNSHPSRALHGAVAALAVLCAAQAYARPAATPS